VNVRAAAEFATQDFGCDARSVDAGLFFTSLEFAQAAFGQHRFEAINTNAVNFSSARTTKRFPSSRCASAIQNVRALESIAETQPQLQPALLRLSAY
jgi:hypothetical protein